MSTVFSLLLAVGASASASDFRFVVVGDTQTDGSHSSINWDVLPLLIEDMNTHDPTVGLFVGDLVGGTGSIDGTVAQWADFQTATADFTGQLLAVPGNHDVYGGAGTFEAWRETFPELPTDDSPSGEEGVSYYWDEGDVRFVSITSDQEVSNPYNVSADGLVWLQRVLGDSDSFEHVFVMTHHPVSFSTEGGLGHTGDDFWQTLVNHDVAAMFAGHWHRYQPAQLGNGGDTWETIIGTGGGWLGFEPIRPEQQRHGFLLVDVEGSEVTATFYADEDGDGHFDDILDSFTMRSAVEPTRGLRLHYSFDDTLADTAPLGNGLDATLSGDAALIEDGAQGGALRLDGDEDFANGRAIDAWRLSLKDDLSLSVWMRTETLSSASWGNALACYGTNDYYTEDEETNYAWWLSMEADGSPLVFWEYENGNNITVTATEPVPDATDGDFHHLVATRDADSRTVTFYWDGGVLGDPVSFERLPTGASRGLVYVGADTEGYYDSEFAGDLDELCVFDLVLDADAVAELGSGTSCPDLFEAEPDPDDDDDDDDDTGGDDGDDEDDDDGGDDGTGEPDVDPDDTEDTTESESGVDGSDEDGKVSGCSHLAPMGPAGLGLLMFGIIGRRRSLR